MGEPRLGLVTLALAAVVGASALASGPRASSTMGAAPATAPAAPGQTSTEAATTVTMPAATTRSTTVTNPSPTAGVEGSRSTSSAASLTGTVPLTAVPWGSAFDRYLKLLEDPAAPVEALERARAEFQSALEPSAASPSLAPAESTSDTPRTSR